ncbi:MAG: YHS domain-containing protein [Betaproteobacteria bacterium]
MQFQNVVYFLVWAGLFFVMMRFGCGSHIMGHGHRHSGSHAHDRGSWTPPEGAVDPVCGMTVATATAKSAVNGSHIFYFCSQECREKFEVAPASYVGANDPPPKLHEEHRHGH